MSFVEHSVGLNFFTCNKNILRLVRNLESRSLDIVHHSYNLQNSQYTGYCVNLHQVSIFEVLVKNLPCSKMSFFEIKITNKVNVIICKLNVMETQKRSKCINNEIIDYFVAEKNHYFSPSPLMSLKNNLISKTCRSCNVHFIA